MPSHSTLHPHGHPTVDFKHYEPVSEGRTKMRVVREAAAEASSPKPSLVIRLPISDQVSRNRALSGVDQDIPVTAALHDPAAETPSIHVRATGFVNHFKTFFQSDIGTLTSFKSLCRAFLTRQIDEVSFYTGLYRLIAPTKSDELLARCKQFLPKAWNVQDVLRLDAKIQIEIDSKMEIGAGKNEYSLPKKRKRVPARGWKAGQEAKDIDFSGDDTVSVGAGTLDPHSPTPISKKPRIVVAKTERSKAPMASARHPPEPADASQKEQGQAPVPAPSVRHFRAIYPTRYAVFHRSDKPYICSLCSRCFAHPWHVKDHFKSNCWSHRGKPDLSWDRHGSCRVGYVDVNCSKVAGGYVLRDQESLDRIEGACEVGRRLKREMGIVDGDDEHEVESGSVFVTAPVPKTFAKAG